MDERKLLSAIKLRATMLLNMIDDGFCVNPNSKTDLENILKVACRQYAGQDEAVIEVDLARPGMKDRTVWTCENSHEPCALTYNWLVCQCETCKNAPLFPCLKCGVMRSQREGGSTFTICEECWNKKYGEKSDGSIPTVTDGPTDRELWREYFKAALADEFLGDAIITADDALAADRKRWGVKS